MNSQFNKLMEHVGPYKFDPAQLDALPITGKLKQSSDPANCILVISSAAKGDLVVEIHADDVASHEIDKGDDAGDLVTLHVKPTAIVTVSLTGKIANSVVPAFVLTSSFGLSVREPTPSLPWRELVTPFSRIDVMLNILDNLSWMECRARVIEQCAVFRTGPLYDACITNGYLACGARPALRVDERTLEQLAEIFRERIPPIPPDPPI